MVKTGETSDAEAALMEVQAVTLDTRFNERARRRAMAARCLSG
jgi:hypothetical protein